MVLSKTTIIMMDMLVLWLLSQMREGFPSHLLFQQDGAPSNFHLNVRVFLDEQLPESWIGYGRPIPWPSRSRGPFCKKQCHTLGRVTVMNLT
jgi:hypothetical protein